MKSESKKRGFRQHRKSSALVVSVVIHSAFIFVALSIVAVSVVMKDEVDFEAKEVTRPKMNLRKLQVPVNMKKTPAPKLRKNFVVKPRTSNVNITMPELVGVKGGLGTGPGSGLGGLGFGFELPDLFGGNKRGSGNEFVGCFYDLKQTKDGRPSEIGELLAKAAGDWDNPNYKASREKYKAVISRFLNGWNAGRLNGYFMAPREKFATSFVIPRIDAEEAPKAFGVEGQVEPMEWIALYRGQIVAPESGKYRFVGLADDVLVVRVKKELVIDASWTSGLTDWKSNDPDSRKYQCYGRTCEVGDWFYLEKGKPVPMEVLIGEEPGGYFFCQLYIQKQGVEYSCVTETHEDKSTNETIAFQRPILPVFRTAVIPDKVAEQMKLVPEYATIDGPSFGVIR